MTDKRNGWYVHDNLSSAESLDSEGAMIGPFGSEGQAQGEADFYNRKAMAIEHWADDEMIYDRDAHSDNNPIDSTMAAYGFRDTQRG